MQSKTVIFGNQWVYDGEFLYCEKYHYDISKRELLNDDWIYHMSTKKWVDMEEFKRAYEYVINEIKQSKQ
jgi:hypothetical protein